MSRREFIQLSAYASVVCGIVTLRNSKQEDHLVIQLDQTNVVFSVEQIRTLEEGLRASGSKNVTIVPLPHGSKINCVGKQPTFRNWNHDAPYSVQPYSGDKHLRFCEWADSESGLVCELENDGQKIISVRRIVSRYPDVHFVES